MAGTRAITTGIIVTCMCMSTINNIELPIVNEVDIVVNFDCAPMYVYTDLSTQFVVARKSALLTAVKTGVPT